MAVAAGGWISQTIARGPYSASRWEAGQPIVFNVQVLNSDCFDFVTGRAALPSPVDARTYTDLGCPFFEMYGEPSGITGKFAQVMSVAELDEDDETHYTPPIKKIKLAGRGKSNLDSDSLLNPNGPLSVFRSLFEIEAELKELKLQD
jgi:hypothetical protein